MIPVDPRGQASNFNQLGQSDGVAGDPILDLLRCVVCMDYFSVESSEKSPRLLDCSHSFCLTCCQDLASSYSKLKAQSNENCIPCPVCRTLTYLGEEGIEGLRPNLTAIGLLDVPLLNDLRRPILVESIQRLREDLASHIHQIQKNQIEIQAAIEDVTHQEKAEILKSQMEYDWVIKLLKMRLSQQISSLESAFALDKNLLLSKYEELQCTEMLFNEHLEAMSVLLNEDSCEHSSLIKTKLMAVKLLKDKSDSLDVSSTLVQSKNNVHFVPTFYSQLVRAAMLFGVVEHPAKTYIVQVIDSISRLINFDWRAIQTLLLRLTDCVSSTMSTLHRSFLRGREVAIRGLSWTLGCRASLIQESEEALLSNAHSFVLRRAYIPCITIWRLVSTTWVDFILSSLFGLLRNEKSLLHEPQPLSEPVLRMMGAVSRVSGISAVVLNGIGYDCAQLRRLGYSAKELKEAGLADLNILKRLGYGPVDLLVAGFPFESLVTAGFNEIDLILGRY